MNTFTYNIYLSAMTSFIYMFIFNKVSGAVNHDCVAIVVCSLCHVAVEGLTEEVDTVSFPQFVQ